MKFYTIMNFRVGLYHHKYLQAYAFYQYYEEEWSKIMLHIQLTTVTNVSRESYKYYIIF
jgi:hypothetical protein